jgi:hypothetical protein
MGVRNVLILFFSAMAVSLVILIVFFSLFFKNFDNLITFDTKLPESAPELNGFFDNQNADPNSKADGVAHSTINVPEDLRNKGIVPAPAMPEASIPATGAGMLPDPNSPVDPTLETNPVEGEPPVGADEKPQAADGDGKPDTKADTAHAPVKKPKPVKAAASAEPPAPKVAPVPSVPVPPTPTAEPSEPAQEPGSSD